MTLAVFDLNDSAIGHGDSHDNWQHSPGYALLADDAIITGEAARQRFWLEPQKGFQQYWQQLNLSPLRQQSDFARHHADLAYAQLQQLYRDSGEPGEVILAVPGHFSSEQLSLLLGLVNASPFSAVGLVDSAVAAVASHQSLAAGKAALHVDIHLHQVVITRIEQQQTLQRVTVEHIDELGLKTLLDSWAKWVSDQFIQQYRYDPLHTASGEQQLFDRLPGWLEQLSKEPQVAAALETDKGTLRLNLLREQLLGNTASRLSRLQQAITKLGGNDSTLYLSHRIAQLPGISGLSAGATITLDHHAALTGTQAHEQSIRSNPEALSFTTSLPQAPATTDQPPVDDTVASPKPVAADGLTDVPTDMPTHALIGHRAIAIGQQLAFRLGDDGLEPCEVNEQALLQLSVNGSGLRCQAHPEADIEVPPELRSGSVIRVGDKALTLIEVLEQQTH